MLVDVDFSKLKTSWTKYDIVQVMDVVYDKETLYKFKKQEAKIDEPILRSFLGVNSLKDPLPDYWLEIQNHPKEKSLFALFCVLFTHGDIIASFANKYSEGNMKGVFTIENGKQYTNIRSALIESGAAAPFLRREDKVPYDFTPIFQNLYVGKLFKQVLEERITRLLKRKPTQSEFYAICYANDFYKALSVSKTQFKDWLEGIKVVRSSFIDAVHISNFFSVEDVNLKDIEGAKEVYFLGENGDGKSLILMAIYLAFNRHLIVNEMNKEKTGKVVDIIKNNKRMELIGIDDRNKVYAKKNVGFLNNFLAYGTHRGRYSTDDPEEYGFMSLFDNNQTLTNPVSWLKHQKYLELSLGTSKENQQSSLSVSSLEKIFHNLLEKNVKISVDGRGVTFEEKGTILNFDQLSEGYKSIIIFISDLLSRLLKNQPETKNIEELHGIVLVDEIDLHLHPKWQRSLAEKLRKLLPNIQFMFTTHSPTIIQGASNDAIIYRVFRNSNDGKTRVSAPYYRKDLNHLMINTLLTSPLFGLEDSRLDTNNNNSDTSQTYLLYKINKKLEDMLSERKEKGETFISDNEIDSLIQNIIDEELG
ncbi:AAA family ATPase [Aureispira anguillae]|uniref:AAA family ATPase n=1 Tax=Aureispira anguillae TaxID=2864201 RepID=A0A915YCM0_9BACT|nr:AAA family ATPase [Aureispira anguillae]BDS10612.1 AAA family ATPase [Aureispira anguillae]